MKGYITKYYNDSNCCYYTKCFKTKREASKKWDAKKKIEVIVTNWEDIYFGANFKGWCTNNIIETFSK